MTITMENLEYTRCLPCRLVVGESGNRDVGYPIPKVVLLQSGQRKDRL